MSSSSNTAANREQRLVYEIRIEGHLGRQRAGWFGEVTLTLEENGTTLLTCPVVDQAQLYGLLRKVRDLGVPLLSIIRVKPPWHPSHPNTIQ